MDTRKIGAFLKTLRKEKSLTQEQLAEILLVSGKTVSRWETGSNMPDLSILIQIAEFYEVDVREILDGERKEQPMRQELRQTLDSIADYSKLEKEWTVRTGQTAFVIMFAVCAAVLVLQLMTGSALPTVLGETVTLFAGGVAYIGMMLYRGIGSPDTPVKDALTGLLCSGGTTLALIVRCARLGMPPRQIAAGAILFFFGIMILGFSLMKALTLVQRKRKGRKNRS